MFLDIAAHYEVAEAMIPSGNPERIPLEDRLTRVPNSVEELHLQILAQIRDSLTVQGKNLAQQGEMVAEMNARVIRLEEREGRLSRLETQFEKLDARVDVLLKDKDRRDGAISAWGWLLKNWPGIVAMFVTIGTVLVATGKL